MPVIANALVYAALLAIRKTDEALILIENPEAHLYPAGQTKMGEFLTRAAACGVQCIVETVPSTCFTARLEKVCGLAICREGLSRHTPPPSGHDLAINMIQRAAKDNSSMTAVWSRMSWPWKTRRSSRLSTKAPAFGYMWALQQPVILAWPGFTRKAGEMSGRRTRRLPGPVEGLIIG